MFEKKEGMVERIEEWTVKQTDGQWMKLTNG